jgi:DNA-binding response OmpR family regulator
MIETFMSNEQVPDQLLPEESHLLIVDDDPISASILEAQLSRHGFSIKSVSSGAECLAAMDGFLPLIVLLDIEMPDMDGYETCRQVRRQYDRSDLTIIFLSAHDSLDERLRAYDVGGDDFVPKPFDAEELHRKIAVAATIRAQRKEILQTNAMLEQSISTAIQSFSDTGAALRFARNAFGCQTLEALGTLIIDTMNTTQCVCHVYLEGSAALGSSMMTPRGPATPLEESVIGSMRSHDRIFQFKSRMIVNYDSVSILVINMPANDEVFAGRIRDHAATIAEIGQDVVTAISTRANMLLRAQDLKTVALQCNARAENLQSIIQAQQMEVRHELNKMTESIEAMYYKLGLSDQQEHIISQTVRDTVTSVTQLFGQYGKEFLSEASQMMEKLQTASTIDLSPPIHSKPTDELWG